MDLETMGLSMRITSGYLSSELFSVITPIILFDVIRSRNIRTLIWQEYFYENEMLNIIHLKN